MGGGGWYASMFGGVGAVVGCCLSFLGCGWENKRKTAMHDVKTLSHHECGGVSYHVLRTPEYFEISS